MWQLATISSQHPRMRWPDSFTASIYLSICPSMYPSIYLSMDGRGDVEIPVLLDALLRLPNCRPGGAGSRVSPKITSVRTKGLHNFGVSNDEGIWYVVCGM